MTNEPEDANSTSKLLKISICGNQSCASKFGQRGGNAINKGKFMQGLDLA